MQETRNKLDLIESGNVQVIQMNLKVACMKFTLQTHLSQKKFLKKTLVLMLKLSSYM